MATIEPSLTERRAMQTAGSADKNFDLEDKLCKDFPEIVYQYLSPLVQKSISTVTENPQMYSNRIRDVHLMSNLTAYGVLFGHVRFSYGAKKFSPNLFYVIKGETGSGKSIMTLSDCILRSVNRFLLNETKRRRDEWEESKDRWDEEKQQARKEKRPIDYSLKPDDEPPYLIIQMPASTSKSQLEMTIKAMEDDGLEISSSEINTLVDAMAKDYGQFQDLLCKMSLNERIGDYYKVNGKPITVDSPMVTIRISGTSDQWHKLFVNIIDGSFRRFLHHQMKRVNEWKPQFMGKSLDNYQELYDWLAEDALQMWLWQRQYKEINVSFTDEQMKAHTKMWTSLFDEYTLECGDNNAGLPESYGFIHLRIAVVLTMLRVWHENRDRFLSLDFKPESFDPNIVCTDEDYEVATAIIQTLYRHAVALSTTKVQKPMLNAKEMEEYGWTSKALEALYEKYGASTFTSSDWKDIVMGEPFCKSRATAYRNFVKLVKMKVIKTVRKDKLFRLKADICKIFEKKA